MRLLSTLALGLGAALASGAAHAMPTGLAVDDAALIHKVLGGDGCGPRAIRTPRGFCRPVGPPPGYGYGPPRGYGYGPPRAYGYGPPRGYGYGGPGGYGYGRGGGWGGYGPRY